MGLFNNKRKVYITMNDKREKFASRLGFILVSAGCAVGLGNVWKFPYICGKNGGAAFIVIYLLCLLGLGLPILICEYAIGRGSNKSLGSAFKMLSPEGTRWHHFRWVAYAGNYLLMMFYTMVAGWMLNYFVYSLTGRLSGKNVEQIGGEFNNMLSTPSVMIFWTLVVVVISILVCSLGLQKGVEKISKVMMILLFALMIIMAVNSLLLDGSSEGLKFYLVPDFSKMKEQDLKVYGALRKDPQFIQQLVQLCHELQTAQMDFTDLELLEEAEKREDLLAIFEAVSEMLVQHQYESQSKMAFFLNQVEEGQLEEQLQDVAIRRRWLHAFFCRRRGFD